MTPRVRAFTSIAAMAWLMAMPVWTQTAGTGALSVNVNDPTSASIPGARVSVKSTATGVTRTEQTTSNGSYTFTLLPPGSYTVTITAAGFTPVEIPYVQVNVTETHVLNQNLSVGTAQQQVEVIAAAEVLQTESATQGDVVGSRAIIDMP